MGENLKENEEQKNYNFLQGRIIATAPPGEQIVISGISGTFPNSTDIYHFQHNLFNKVNMVLPNRRWNFTHPEIPFCSGTIPVADKYDAGFFGVHPKQAEAQDAMSRNLLEKAVEAIFDAGLSLADLEGTNTGVYLGVCFSETEKAIFQDKVLPNPEYGITGCTRSSLAHRLSYFLKLKGPSFITDTACSSSSYALEAAFRDLRLGIIDAALVGGVNMCFHPFVSLQFARVGILSFDGKCKVFDANGNGYARSETVAVILLQKEKVAKRNYSDLIYVKTNCDGFKEEGKICPSGEAQGLLLTEFYKDADINPASLSYLEAHGTGTVVGDVEECTGIDEILAKCRTDPLLVGSVKSNIGHSEPASGLCSIIKCIISFETGFIPPNINFTKPRENIRGIVEGRMKVVTEKTPFKDNRGLVGINNFGFGGGNCHFLLKSLKKEKIKNGLPQDDIPRVVCFSGRVEGSMTTFMDELKNNPLDAEHIRLVQDAFGKNVPNHLYRGYSILSKKEEICRFYEQYPGNKTPLYFAFGELNDWYSIGKNLMVLPPFSASIQKAHRLLETKGLKIENTIFGNPKPVKHEALGSILVEIGIIDVFKTLELQSTNYFGRSVGELIAAYFDGILSFNQTVECAFVISDFIEKTIESAKGKVTKNGSPILEHFRTCFKSSEFLNTKKTLLTNLYNILDKSKNHVNGKNKEKFGSAEYFVNALIQNCPIEFEYLERKSVLLSIGAVKKSRKVLDDVTIIEFGSPKNTDYLVSFLKTLGNLYVNGYNPQLSRLYPDIKFPVSRGTRMISPFIRWSHDREWFTPSYNLRPTESIQERRQKILIQTSDHQWSFVQGHVIDGINLFPTTGYLYLVWETLALVEDVPMNIMEVVFEDCKFIRATTLPKKGTLTFYVFINKFSGRFEILEGDSLVVTGKAFSRYNDIKVKDNDFNNHWDNNVTMKSNDVYKELRLRGYNYTGEFRSIQECNINATTAYIKWNNNWITFMDNMLQLKILQTDTRLLYVPTYIAQLVLPAKHHLEMINTKYIQKQKETILPVTCNLVTGEIRCGKLCIKGLMASSISRRKDLGIPVLESYCFIPNVTNLNLHDSVRVNMQIFLENSLTRKVKTVELVDDFTKDNTLIIDLIQSTVEDEPLVTQMAKIISKKSIDTIIQVKDKELSSEQDCNIIIGSEVLQRPEILKMAASSLKEGGFLLSRESLNFDPSKIETNHFSVFTIHTTPKEIIVFLMKNSKLDELTTIEIDSSTQFTWVEILKEIIKMKKSDDVLLYSQNDPNNGILGLVNCLRREPESTFVKGLLIMDEAEDFDKKKPFYKNQLSKNMAINIWKDRKWGTYRHLRLKEHKTIVSEHCYVNTTIKGDLSSLRWIENSFRSNMIVPQEKELVYIHYASLNFRDIMTAMGKINEDVIIQNRLEQECVQGIEFSGYDKNGTRVMGMVPYGALSSLVLADKHSFLVVPEALSLEEAATIPIIYSTLIYGMIIRGKLKRNETVLIHSGTGGIGQAAIRICLYYGCRIFTTVGTQEKKEFLLKTFPQIKESDIGNSHDLSFEKMIVNGTNGKGVDMVLNSLADQKLIASVRCLGRGGRFIEIGKFDLANNSELNLILLNKEASFHGVMFDKLMNCPPEIRQEICSILKNNYKTFVIPLPTTVFGYNQVEDAFRYMASGKHKGKVLVKVRDDEILSSKTIQKFCGIPRYICNPNKTYIILGGLGGFGLELADWLVLRGAQNLVLTSRKGITTGYQELRVNRWSSYGVNVQISEEDITTEQGCQHLLEEANTLAEVQSIFNLAVVLDDAIFENQTDAAFKTSFAPKAIATAHLDKLSRIMCPNLKEFVIFSSVTCGRGNAGQTNYGMANSVMERICERRKREGLPALAIQWGAVGDVGLVAELQEEHIELEIGGTLQQKISSCLNVLNNLLRQKESTIVSSMVVAEKKGELALFDNVADTVLSILGLDNAKAVSHHSTLPELGMDSKTAIEIRQNLEREFEIFLTAKDMKSMTLAKLKKIQEEKFSSGEDEEAVTENFSMSLDNIGDEEEIKLIEVHLNSDLKTNDTSKILMFPGVEGFAKKFSTLASHLATPAIAFQYWDIAEYQTIQEIAQSLLPRVERLIKPNERFNIIALSVGSLIGLEIVYLLELKGYVGHITIVDGGPMIMKRLSELWLQGSDNLFETRLISYIMSFYLPSEIIAEYYKPLLDCKTWEHRLDLSEATVKSVVPDKIEVQRKLINGIYNKVKATQKYTPSFEKLKSTIRLYKPTQLMFKDMEKDYGLSKYTESEVVVEVFGGNHGTVLENKLLAEAINSLTNKLRTES